MYFIKHFAIYRLVSVIPPLEFLPPCIQYKCLDTYKIYIQIQYTGTSNFELVLPLSIAAYSAQAATQAYSHMKATKARRLQDLVQGDVLNLKTA